MRAIENEELDIVSGGTVDSLGPVTGIQRGLALRAIGGSLGAAAAVGWGIGTLIYNTFDTQIADAVDYMVQ